MITAILAEPMILNATGNPGMATAGAGDVLTGTIAGLIAQGVDAEEAGVLGCFLHGLAGDVAARRLGMRGLIAGDIVRALPAAITALESGLLAKSRPGRGESAGAGDGGAGERREPGIARVSEKRPPRRAFTRCGPRWLTISYAPAGCSSAAG